MGSKPQDVSKLGLVVAARIKQEQDARGLSDRALSRILGKASAYVVDRSKLRKEWSLADLGKFADAWGMSDATELMHELDG